MERHVVRIEEDRCAVKVLIGEPAGKRHLGRPTHWWEENIRMDLKELGFSTRGWVGSTQDSDYWRALVNAALDLRASWAMLLYAIWICLRISILASVVWLCVSRWKMSCKYSASKIFIIHEVRFSVLLKCGNHSERFLTLEADILNKADAVIPHLSSGSLCC